MKRFKKFGSLLCCALFIAPGFASAETLSQAVQSALETHPSVEAALAGKEIAAQDLREQQSGYFPELNASATGGRMFANNSTTRGLVVSRGEAYSWLWEGSASITQPIFNGMETINRVDAAKARQKSALYNVSDTKENLALRATQAYVSVLRASEALLAIKEYEKTMQGYLERIQLMVDEGAADEVEAAQARNISLLLANTMAEFEGQLRAAQAEYNEIIGRMPEDHLEKPIPRMDMIISDLEDALTYAKTSHPSIMAATEELEAAGYEIDAERGTLYPDLNGELSYLKKDQKEEIGGELIDARAVLRANWTFSTGGAELARISRTKAEYSEMLAQSRETIREIERQVRQAYSEYDTVREQLELLQKREKVVQGLYDAYQTQFEGARVRLLQLMQAENQLFTVRLDKIDAEYRYLLSQFNILASIGRLKESLNLGQNSGKEEKAFLEPDMVREDSETALETKLGSIEEAVLEAPDIKDNQEDKRVLSEEVEIESGKDTKTENPDQREESDGDTQEAKVDHSFNDYKTFSVNIDESKDYSISTERVHAAIDYQ